MFRLVTFGGLALVDDAGALQATQRRRLAILALLAAGGGAGLSRDKLLAYLWPESPTESARHTLEQLLYGLRRQVNRDLFLSSNPLVLNTSVIESDIAQFGRALEAGDLEKAVGLYRGPFLDGFYLSEAAEFERWVEAERSRLADRHAGAVRQLATQAGERGDRVAALEWWRRLVETDPYATGPTLKLMQTLADSGNRVAALERARIHEALLREEIGTAPSPEITQLAEQLRNGPEVALEQTTAPRPMAAPSPVTRVAPTVEGLAVLQAAETPQREPPSATPSDRQAAHSGQTTPVHPTARRWMVAGVALAIALVIPVVLGTRYAHRHNGSLSATPPRLNRALVAIVPFQVATADSSLRDLSEGMLDLLAARFTGEGGPQAIDSRTTLAAWHRIGSGFATADSEAAGLKLARTLGAGELLEGEAVSAPGVGLTLNGRLRSTTDGRVRAQASVSGKPDSMGALVDQLAAALLVLDANERPDRLSMLEATPLPALRAYLAGRSAYRHGQYEIAVEDFSRAVALDSTFAIASLESASASGLRFRFRPVEPAVAMGPWPIEDDSTWYRAIAVARRSADRLNPSDRVYLARLAGARFPELTPALEQLTGWEDATEADPGRADLWYHFGLLLLFQGPATGLSDARARAATAFERARTLDSEFVAPIAGLIEVAAFARDSTALRQLEPLYLAKDSTSELSEYVRWRVATGTRDANALRALHQRFDSLPSSTLSRILWTSQIDGIGLDDADRAAALLMQRTGNSGERLAVCAKAGFLALNRGRSHAAEQVAHQILNLNQYPSCFADYSILYSMYWDADSAWAAPVVAELTPEAEAGLRLGRHTSPDDIRIAVLIAQWRFWQGDTTLLARVVSVMRAEAKHNKAGAADWYRTRGDILRAMLATAAGSPDARALTLKVDSVARLGCCGSAHWINPILARLWERQGDLGAALAAVRRTEWYFAPEYLSAALREEGRLAALTGDRKGAIRAYRHLLELQTNPDPERKPLLQGVRAQLAQLERGQH